MREVVVEAPASSANLGPGFDVFAIALKRPVDRIRVLTRGGGGTGIAITAPKKLGLPTSSRDNVLAVVASEIGKDHEITDGLDMVIEKKIPIGYGIGSSAASATACAVAMDRMFNLHLSMEEMVYYAGKGEKASSGAAHYDNVSASLYGGFVLLRKGERPRPVRFEAPRSLRICIATPHVELPARKTEYARSILPKNVELSRMVSNVSSASTLVAGFSLGNIEMIGDGMRDEVVEPVRSRLIPGYELVKERALKSGASGICISGAGPSLLAAVDARRCGPDGVLSAMLSGFRSAGLKADGFVTSVGEGARVVESG